ncbi:PD-(D/E)XK nuclease superfamily protein [Nocardioides sp. J9]|uniref:PD-(D/E)XK nuclease family protein n=1 Tax=Nocardioides sp. J9 TaxID=935844 RepID=UPI0011A8B303|nr:PD-(D/E)XK nuclease family protein [Nocardioides sp. J9]TWG97111.1 PD-(D/E)XK nuclease superfamily protein [Nocardioides sp. J9]
MADDLVRTLLPALGRAARAPFNVFDVMRHGTHEKQLSNVFGWLLDPEGTHALGDLFQRIFIEHVNRRHQDAFTDAPYTVIQEVNTSEIDATRDIADIVLESQREMIVVENYYSSDGHGHGYDRYLNYAQQHGRRGCVVLLCQHEDSSRQTDGWQWATVITYSEVIDDLWNRLADTYRDTHPEQHSFIEHLHRKFSRGRARVKDAEIINFIEAMCTTGEARRYRDQSQEAAAHKLAADIGQQAIQRFEDGRELLQRAKARAKAFCVGPLASQLAEALGGTTTKVSANYSGIYQWTVNIELQDLPTDRLQVKFGPSAWYAIEEDPHWVDKPDGSAPDYSKLFVTVPSRGQIRQTDVSLDEVLTGLTASDSRIRDAVVALLRPHEDA